MLRFMDLSPILLPMHSTSFYAVHTHNSSPAIPNEDDSLAAVERRFACEIPFYPLIPNESLERQLVA